METVREIDIEEWNWETEREKSDKDYLSFCIFQYNGLSCQTKYILSAMLHMKDTLHDTKQTLAPIFINALAY